MLRHLCQRQAVVGHFPCLLFSMILLFLCICYYIVFLNLIFCVFILFNAFCVCIKDADHLLLLRMFCSCFLFHFLAKICDHFSSLESSVIDLKLHCVSKKRHPFYFCKNLAKYYPISKIFGSSIPEEIYNKNMHVYSPHLFTVLIPYFVKSMIHLPVLHCFNKWQFYCVQQVCQVPSNLIILADTCQKNFVTKLFRHSATKPGFTCCNCTL